ncbi:CatA-like O-acetyltransferase [Hymenobacter psychrophilus]|uniref:Chloramphenicol O-acetyltransferase type A n=1 Tax=Hymenobacter psychrophilus TaxID=651662 RepID=A0A1H3EPI3_9BACT|nr:CatA-like O-acetyltransferase [Hymenobacter psychrophilus]SDX80662.1 chloramphenicol O-acetyltransferase type A [Hymenobacter psychrophilus]
MKHRIEQAGWNRQEHFAFFSQFDEPFFGLVADVDATRAYARARELGVSFFQLYLHATVAAVQTVENLRYRINPDGQVDCYDQINVSAILSRPDHTFAFSFIPFRSDLHEFGQGLATEAEAVRQSSGLRLSPATGRPDVIHFSAMPWLSFTGLTHARSFASPADSIPKISVGRLRPEGSRQLLPVSVNVHHGLADGYHVGLLLAELQRRLDG